MKKSKSFKDASRNEILMISMDTTFEYLIDDGGAVVWPSDTNIYFLLNFPFILMSNIMCTLMCSYPGLLFLFFHITACNVVKFLKFYTEVCHLFCNCLGPKSSPRLTVNIILLIYWLRYLYTKLMWWMPIIWFYLGNNPILLAKSLLNLPSEGRLITYFIRNGILRQFNWVVLFMVL